jgi:acetyltransferase EpsM
MNAPQPVLIPLLNPNEPEALLASLYVQEGQRVQTGDPICSLETTKSTGDVLAEGEGYIAGLRFAEGQTVRAGDVLAYLVASPEDAAHLPVPAAEAPAPGRDGGEIPAGLRITRPALELARQHQLDLSQLPFDRLVTETAVRSLLSAAPAAHGRVAAPFDAGSILLYGGGGHARMLIDLLRGLPGITPAGIVDDGLEAGSLVLDVPVLGGGDRLEELHTQGLRLALNAVGGIGNIGVRIQVFQRLAQAGFAFPSAVHARAVVESSARLAAGSQVFALAYVGSQAQVGFGAIVNTGAIVSHDCLLEDYAIVSPGALLAGEVHLGQGALVGMGVTINLRVKVGAGARIGNGATIKVDVPEQGVVRAGAVWPE